MSMNVNTLESYFPVPGVTHADETVDSTVRQLAALNAKTRLVMISVTADILATFDGSIPASDGRGHKYVVDDVIHMNEVSAAAFKWVEAEAGTSGVMTVTELQRT